MTFANFLFNLNLVLFLARLSPQVVQSKPISEESSSPSGAETKRTNFETQPQHAPVSSSSGFQNDPVLAIHYQFDQEMEPVMQLNRFSSPSDSSAQTGGNNVTCNDGTPAGYYKRLNNHSKSWIIYLQGGGYCGSEEACQMRWRRSPHLMSSNFWPRTISVDGILSSEAKDNPYLWNANHIYVPYCSSDSWTGLQEARNDQSSFAFTGSKIIEKVLDSLFDDLPRDSSLFEARFILLAGDSAGATGVILNLDKVNRFVQQRFDALRSKCSYENPQLCEQKQVPIIRGLADSGWFLDNEPYDIYQQLQQENQRQHHNQQQSTPQQPAAASGLNADGETISMAQSNEPIDCDRQRCSPLLSIKQAMIHWNGQVPTSCANRQPNEPWRCYFAYRAYPTLKTPLFVVQWLYDEAQLLVDNIIRPGTISQWNYVNKLVGELRTSLENVTALFAPSCFSHSLIIKQSWNQININGFKLPHILNSWEEETLANQPTYEMLLKDQELPDLSTRSNQYPLTNSNQVVTINRDQLYDRLLVQQQQQSQHLQQPNHLEMRSAIHRTAMSNSAPGSNSNGGHTRPRSRKKKRNHNNGNQNFNSNRAGNANRLSRSTVFDDSTTVLNNNVPDALLMSANKPQETGAERFRLIDTCGWPQCNRDCPNFDLDFRLRSMMAY